MGKRSSTVILGLDAAIVERLYARAKAERWSLPIEVFAAALAASARHAFGDESPPTARLVDYFNSLHLEDLALACACAEGIDIAWDHFVSHHRPLLYRAADAIDPSGGAREAADSLYGELYGLTVRDGQRQSHFRYFHGRSSLATWLRAVLSQRYVDCVRRESRFTPLPSDDAEPAMQITSSPAPSSVVARYVELLGRALATAIASLAPRDRLRLRCYYSQEMTLAQIGKLLGEHEATVSRHLARSRRTLRELAEAELREREKMSEREIEECFAAAIEDPGAMNLADLLPEAEPAPERARKNALPDRSK